MNLWRFIVMMVRLVLSNLLINSSKSLEVGERDRWKKETGGFSPSIIFPPQLLVCRELSVPGDLLSGVDIVWLLASTIPVIIRRIYKVGQFGVWKFSKYAPTLYITDDPAVFNKNFIFPICPTWLCTFDEVQKRHDKTKVTFIIKNLWAVSAVLLHNA